MGYRTIKPPPPPQEMVPITITAEAVKKLFLMAVKEASGKTEILPEEVAFIPTNGQHNRVDAKWVKAGISLTYDEATIGLMLKQVLDRADIAGAIVKLEITSGNSVQDPRTPSEFRGAIIEVPNNIATKSTWALMELIS